MSNNLLSPVILWFRQDLRLNDNQALNHANETGRLILPIYISDENEKIGSTSKWWLHKSLQSLDDNIQNKLNFFKGDPLNILLNIIKNTKATDLFFNVCYEPYNRKRDRDIHDALESLNVKVHRSESATLLSINESLKNDQTPYKVFGAFYKNICLNKNIEKPLNKPKNINFQKYSDSIDINELKLLSSNGWHKKFENLWQPGEEAGLKRLHSFLDDDILAYKDDRNYPGKYGTSILSPYLHYGEVSPRYLWHSVKNMSDIQKEFINAESYLREIGWREFNYSLLYNFPSITDKNLRPKFDKFEWKNDKDDFDKWCKGKTGYPLVDAGMRQLWQTGHMHNRMRMITGSFLVKHLLIDWRWGVEWFNDTLIDADLANNSANWQWVAGCGVDAAPYFRIFNPSIQGEKFDKNGQYTLDFVPEIKDLPNKYLFKPFKASSKVLQEANIELGKDYPYPIIDHKFAYNRALDTYRKIR